MRLQNLCPRVLFRLTWTLRLAAGANKLGLGANKWRCLCSPESFEVNCRKVQGNRALTPQIYSYVFAQMYNNKFNLYRNFPDTQNNLYIIILKPDDTVSHCKLGFMFVLALTDQ